MFWACPSIHTFCKGVLQMTEECIGKDLPRIRTLLTGSDSSPYHNKVKEISGLSKIACNWKAARGPWLLVWKRELVKWVGWKGRVLLWEAQRGIGNIQGAQAWGWQLDWSRARHSGKLPHRIALTTCVTDYRSPSPGPVLQKVRLGPALNTEFGTLQQGRLPALPIYYSHNWLWRKWCTDSRLVHFNDDWMYQSECKHSCGPKDTHEL